MVEDVIIIGSGPAGYTAAIYAARAGRKPLMITGFIAGGQYRGQLMTTTDVDNFPGFPEGVTGPDLMAAMGKQAERFGTREIQDDVVSIDFSQKPYVVKLKNKEFQTKAIIIATGAQAKLMDVPGHDEFWQKGISACAVCDGAIPIFRDNPLLVVGGGDTACEEATFLTKYASKVYLAVRRDVFRASKAMADEVMAHDKIEVLFKHQLKEVRGDKLVQEVVLFHSDTKEEVVMPMNGVFYGLGHNPNTGFLDGQLEIDEAGYLIAKPFSTATSMPGVFAAGDVSDKIYRQAVTSAGMGCMAALESDRWLGSQE